MRDLTAELHVADPHDRGDAANSVVDWLHSYTKDEADRVGVMLVKLARAETDARAYECQTHALAELTEWDLLTLDTVRAATQLPESGDPNVTEYLEYFHEYLQQEGPLGNADRSADPGSQRIEP